MRLIYTSNNEQQARTFSSFLAGEEVDHELEVSKNADWGSSEYGDLNCKIWIQEEDDVEKVQQWLEEFQAKPEEERFSHPKPAPEPVIENSHPQPQQSLTAAPSSAQSMGLVTMYILVCCVLLMVFGASNAPTFRPYPSALPYTPLFTAPFDKSLLFDYPQAYTFIDNAVKKYGLDAVLKLETLPPEGQALIQQSLHTPIWQGIYPHLVAQLKAPGSPWQLNAPLFEKISKGEVWRLFTPCLLHSGLLHIFFNMIWLVILGKQMEQKLGIMRYVLFILIAGIFSNMSQYFMSGANFIGFSGVLCGMIAFVWVRQKHAPWEGYQLHPSTFRFIAGFVLVMVGIQTVAFAAEIFAEHPLSIGIANTAHLSGALAGFLMGKTNFFKG